MPQAAEGQQLGAVCLCSLTDDTLRLQMVLQERQWHLGLETEQAGVEVCLEG